MAITVEQAKVVASIYKQFVDDESLPWTEFDEHMCNLAWLSDLQLIIEVEVLLENHKSKNARCPKNHPRDQCLVPVVLQVVDLISQDFIETKRLAKKARYILEYYLSLSFSGGIITDNY